MFFMWICKASFIVGTAHRIYVVIWILNVDRAYFRFMMYICIFGSIWDWCVNNIGEVFGSWSIRSCSISEFFLTNNGPLKGIVCKFPSFWINIYINYLLLSPHKRQFYFRYRGDNFLDIWKYLDWYCWPIGLWKFWIWFGPFWW